MVEVDERTGQGQLSWGTRRVGELVDAQVTRHLSLEGHFIEAGRAAVCIPLSRRKLHQRCNQGSVDGLDPSVDVDIQRSIQFHDHAKKAHGLDSVRGRGERPFVVKVPLVDEIFER